MEKSIFLSKISFLPFIFILLIPRLFLFFSFFNTNKIGDIGSSLSQDHSIFFSIRE